MSKLTESQILEDAQTKHKIENLFRDCTVADRVKDLQALIRYARHIGYNEGYQDAKANR